MNNFRGRGNRGGRGNAFVSRGGRVGDGGHSLGDSSRSSANPPQQMPASVEPVVKKSRVEMNKKEPNTIHGTQIELVTNFFPITTKDLLVYHYDISIKKNLKQSGTEAMEVDEEIEVAESSALMEVDMDESTPVSTTIMTPRKATAMEKFIKRISPRIFNHFIANVGSSAFTGVPFVYDGYKNVYTAKKLAFSKKDFLQVMNLNGRTSEYAIQLQEVSSNSQIDFGEVNRYYSAKSKLDKISDLVITVHDIVFRHIIGTDQRLVQHQKSFYFLENPEPFLNFTYMKLVHGFFTSVRMTEFGLALNIDLTVGCILDKIECLDQLVKQIMSDINRGKICQLESLTQANLRALNQALKGYKIYTNHTKNKAGEAITRYYTIDNFILTSPYSAKIVDKDGKEMQQTIAEYFRTQYNIKLINYPVLVKTAGKLGLKLPLELCHLEPNQFVPDSKLDKKGLEERTKTSTNYPLETFNKVADIAARIAKISPSLLSAFGITLSSNVVKVKGRVLSTPQLLNQPARKLFHEVANKGVINNWAMLCYSPTCTSRHLEYFVNMMIEHGKKEGLVFKAFHNHSNIQKIGECDLNSIGEKFSELKRNKVELVLVVTPEGYENKQTYKAVKYCADRFYQLPCCCIEPNKLKYIDSKRGYFDTFLLKVNAKLGGQNKVASPDYLKAMKINMEKTMVVGLDVNHPGQMEKVPSSISAAVGSMNGAMTKYSTQVRVQRQERDEIVHDCGDMIEELVKEYKKDNKNKLPEQLVVFRDGVSEGQFKTVLQRELPLIKSALAKLESHTAKIKLVIVVVQKGHNTRLACTKPHTMGTRNPTFNPPSGTVVDTIITEPNMEGFVLNSHFSLLGTSRPTKYIILKDEANLSMAQLEHLALFSCYNAVQTDRVLSIPTMVHCADSAAYRAKEHYDVARYSTIKDSDAAKARSSAAPTSKEVSQMSRINQMIALPETTRKRPYMT